MSKPAIKNIPNAEKSKPLSNPTPDPEAVFTSEQVQVIVALIGDIIASQEYGELISGLEDQYIDLSTKVHQIKEELEILWKEMA